MKNLLAFVCILSIWYLGTSFICLEIDFNKWGIAQRSLIVLGSICCFFVYKLVELDKELNN